MVNQELSDIKQEIRKIVARHSDRGFVPYGACMRVCGEFEVFVEKADAHFSAKVYPSAVNIYLLMLIETVRLISHADDSSGCCGDIIYYCIEKVEEICKGIDPIASKDFFDIILKAANNKVFNGWECWSYKLLKSAAYLVREQKQAQKIFNFFETHPSDRDDDPDQLLITHAIKKQLEGAEAAERYLLQYLHVPEIRIFIVEEALAKGEKSFAEKLCEEAMEKKMRGLFKRKVPWPYFLERIYHETGQTEKLTKIIHHILFNGDITYYSKLVAIYEQQGVTEEQIESLLDELPGKIGIASALVLLSNEGKLERLLKSVKEHPVYIQYYAKQLAAGYPNDVYDIYEEFIMHEATEARDRRKYKQVCRLMKNLAALGGKNKALTIIDNLSALYPRRPSLLEELHLTRGKIGR